LPPFKSTMFVVSRRTLGRSRPEREVNSTPWLVADHGLAGLTRGERELGNRVVAAGDAARERIERDLHDGAQQRLTVLAMQLGTAAEEFHERGEDEVGALLYGFGRQVEEAIDELRALAHGIYPPLLAAHGLSAALAVAGRHAGQPVSVATNGITRYPQEVESGVYFSCVAAMHNAAKHAGRAE
jgi:signal transduction histidine kinase